MVCDKIINPFQYPYFLLRNKKYKNLLHLQQLQENEEFFKFLKKEIKIIIYKLTIYLQFYLNKKKARTKKMLTNDKIHNISPCKIDTIVNSYLISKCGLKPTTSTSIGLCVRSESSYFRPVEYPNNLDLALSVVKLGKSSVTYEIGVFEAAPATASGGEDKKNKEDQDYQKVCAVGSFVHVFVDSKSRRPKDMESQLRVGLEQLMRGPKQRQDEENGEGRESKL